MCVWQYHLPQTHLCIHTLSTFQDLPEKEGFIPYPRLPRISTSEGRNSETPTPATKSVLTGAYLGPHKMYRGVDIFSTSSNVPLWRGEIPRLPSGTPRGFHHPSCGRRGERDAEKNGPSAVPQLHYVGFLRVYVEVLIRCDDTRISDDQTHVSCPETPETLPRCVSENLNENKFVKNLEYWYFKLLRPLSDAELPTQ